MESERGAAPETGVKEPDAAALRPSVGSKADLGYYSMSATSSADGRVTIGQDIEIFYSKPRQDLASFETIAYEAVDRRQPGAQLALLCRNSRVPRVTAIGSYKAVKNPNLLRLIEAGIVDWKPENRQRLALVFDMPTGRKLQAAPDTAPLRLAEDSLIQALISPVLSVLSDCRNASLIHGAITLENMFLSGAEGAETVILGECLSSAASYRVHPVYLTAERGMANPSGRGVGSVKDDLYALGICVAMVARGQNLMQGRSTQQMVMEKIDSGSYVFASGGERLPGGISDFLRGVLNDDEMQRWDIEDAVRWVEGRRPSPKQPRVTLRAARPFLFKGEKYWDVRSIAMAMCNNIGDAANAIEKDHFDLWVKRNFEDKTMNERVDKLWEKEKGATRERLMTCLSTALDPLAPVRYKSIFAFPEGFGLSLAMTIAKNEDVQIHAEIIAGQYFSNWVSQRFEDMPDASSWVGTFEKCRNFLSQKMPAYGIERVLYILNKEVPCLSPVFANHVVLGPGGLLLALEDVSRRPDRPENILDRHMMAFISVREPKMIDPHLGHVISRERSFQLIGIARTLAAIQRRFQTGPVPGVGNWLISMIAPAIEKFYDRDMRQELSKRMNRLMDSGNLGGILELIDDPRLVQDDLARFALARKEFAGLNRERAQIDGQLKRRQNYGRAAGRQAAMLVSAFLSSLIILVYLMYRFTGGEG
jgi:eukaryotic-like serine/threonine-protein kinase